MQTTDTPKPSDSAGQTREGLPAKICSPSLADFIARKIMQFGDEPQSRCKRIQFKGGQYPSAETNQGGLCESALADVIESAITHFREANTEESNNEVPK